MIKQFLNKQCKFNNNTILYKLTVVSICIGVSQYNCILMTPLLIIEIPLFYYHYLIGMSD